MSVFENASLNVMLSNWYGMNRFVTVWPNVMKFIRWDCIAQWYTGVTICCVGLQAAHTLFFLSFYSTSHKSWKISSRSSLRGIPPAMPQLSETWRKMPSSTFRPSWVKLLSKPSSFAKPATASTASSASFCVVFPVGSRWKASFSISRLPCSYFTIFTQKKPDLPM